MESRSFEKSFYPEITILGHTFVDGTIAFYGAVNSLISKNMHEKILLDLGCGRGAFLDKECSYSINLRNFKGRVKKIIGVDVDAKASSNLNLDEFHLLRIGQTWPIESSSIDFCISDWVLEHLSEKDIPFFFSELNRVMKKGGYVCFRTLNKFSYIAILSSLVPNHLHTKLLKKVQPSRIEEDVFPTIYKCNTVKKISRVLKNSNFDPFLYYHDAEPNYLKFSYISFAFGYYLQKFLPNFLKSTIFAFGMKK